MSEKCVPKQIKDNIYVFPILLPDNPLKWLNCYVIKGNAGERSLLIDSGFNRSECVESLRCGMSALGLEPKSTDVFFTHLHADHTGNAHFLEKIGCRIFMGRIENNFMHAQQQRNWCGDIERAIREGADPACIENARDNRDAFIFESEPFDAECVDDGEELRYGGRLLRCVHTPGHTPGHMCLYSKEDSLAFLGDHILFDISPNITDWYGVEDSLGNYIESLDKMRSMHIEICLPGHRTTLNKSIQTRIDELVEHHGRRLREIEEIVDKNPGINAGGIAKKLSWHMRGKSWEEYSLSSRWFAFKETLAHLDHLVATGRMERTADSNGCINYKNTISI